MNGGMAAIPCSTLQSTNKPRELAPDEGLEVARCLEQGQTARTGWKWSRDARAVAESRLVRRKSSLMTDGPLFKLHPQAIKKATRPLSSSMIPGKKIPPSLASCARELPATLAPSQPRSDSVRLPIRLVWRRRNGASSEIGPPISDEFDVACFAQQSRATTTGVIGQAESRATTTRPDPAPAVCSTPAGGT